MKKSIFEVKWEETRKKGLKEYYLRHLTGVVCIDIAVVLGIVLAKKELDVKYLIVCIVVIGLLPIISWFGNELRYKQGKKK